MILQKGNMWDIYDQTDLFLITANSTLNLHNELIMGKGIALQAREKFKGIRKIFGEEILKECENYGFYGVIIIPNQKIGLFQTKYHWRDKSDLELIFKSTTRLIGHILTSNLKWIDLNFPGIGYGGLNREDVLGIIKVLPDCVHVWEYE
jgi:hypothetical protein